MNASRHEEVDERAGVESGKGTGWHTGARAGWGWQKIKHTSFHMDSGQRAFKREEDWEGKREVIP